VVTQNLRRVTGLRRPGTNGMHTSTDDDPVRAEQNHLLASLPCDEYSRLMVDLEPVCLRAKQIITLPDEPIRHVYFLRDAVVSLLVEMDNRTTIEVASVGSEGLIGLGAFLGESTETDHTAVQIPGHAARMTTTAFHEALWHSSKLQLVLQRYTMAFMNQLARSAGCNGMHSVQQRCARLLLMNDDRLGRKMVPLTHESLAMLLGVRRASVTVAALEFHRLGLIEYQRGHICILDRTGLENVACEDYRLCRDRYERIYH
jgi:CRP-like cAMP-binding protein